MESTDDIHNVLMVWISALASLGYCHALGKFIPKGSCIITRLIAVLPVICLFLLIPLRIKTMHIRGPTSFFLAWLANFKLLLFVFGKPPLSTYPPLSFPQFIAVACLPVKIQKTDSNHNHLSNSKNKDSPSPEIAKKGNKSSPLNYASKLLLLSVLVYIYGKQDHIPRNFILVLYCIHIYISLELMLETIATLVRAGLGLVLEPQFDKPYLATSLQDFWSRRWNLTVTSILHPTVYSPVRSICIPLVGKEGAQFPAVIATFLVSGLMHELIFYHLGLGREKPTGEMTCFFLLHGFCVATEVSIKKAIKSEGKKKQLQLPRFLAAPLVLAFVLATALWLFIPTVLRCKMEVETRREMIAYVNFFKSAYASAAHHHYHLW